MTETFFSLEQTIITPLAFWDQKCNINTHKRKVNIIFENSLNLSNKYKYLKVLHKIFRANMKS